jgi:hypothetical protein
MGPMRTDVADASSERQTPNPIDTDSQSNTVPVGWFSFGAVVLGSALYIGRSPTP